jgi:carboxymethylenebutenolidase
MDSLDSHLKSLVASTDFSRRGFVMTSLASGFALAVQPVMAQTVISTDTNGLEAGEVQIPVAGGSLPAYRAMPNAGGPFPFILVNAEIFGVHEHIKDICRRLGKLGYMAIAPDVFARLGDITKAPDVQTASREFVAKTPDAQEMSDLDAAVAWAKGTGKADINRLGVTGFCRGGRTVWLYAAHNPNVKAAVAWYGPLAFPVSEIKPKNAIDVVAGLKAPVLGLYGGADPGIPVEQIEKLKAALAAAKKPSEIVIYPDTPHAFNADYRPSYRPEAAKDGWNRMLAWFKKYGAA